MRDLRQLQSKRWRCQNRTCLRQTTASLLNSEKLSRTASLSQQSKGLCASLQALDSYVPGAAVGQSSAGTITAQALNEETHEQAMFMVDGASLLHYRDRGKQLAPGPDRHALSPCGTTHELIRWNAGLSPVVVNQDSGLCPDRLSLRVRTLHASGAQAQGSCISAVLASSGPPD